MFERIIGIPGEKHPACAKVHAKDGRAVDVVVACPFFQKNRQYDTFGCSASYNTDVSTVNENDGSAYVYPKRACPIIPEPHFNYKITYKDGTVYSGVSPATVNDIYVIHLKEKHQKGEIFGEAYIAFNQTVYSGDRLILCGAFVELSIPD